MKKIYLFLNKKDRLYYLAFLIIAIILNYIFFNKVNNNQFLFIHDQFFRFSYFEAFINSFFIRKLENLSVLNGWQFTTQFWDAVYYLVIYSLRISFINAEKLLFFLMLFLSLSVSFIGFKKIYTLISKKQNFFLLFFITLWYCFNPYTVILWHAGIYNLGSSITYSLAPLIIYYYHVTVFTDSSFRQKVLCALLIATASFTFWLFAPFVFLLILYSLLYLLFTLRVITKFLKNVFVLLMLYMPLISWIIFSIFYEYFNNLGDNNASFMPTFGNEQGGLWYQILLLSSWGIYTVWTPRAIFSFQEYYFSNVYKNATLTVYFFIIIGAISHYIWLGIKVFIERKADLHLPLFIAKFIKKRTQLLHFDLTSKLLIIFLLLLFSSLFFAKAVQPPFGEIFLYLYDHVPFFSVFRSADIRFGFCVVLSISMLFLLISREFNKYVLAIAIIVIIFLQSPFFFNGKAIQGENIKKLYYDRIIYYPKEYTDVIRFLNKDKSIATYILPLPAIEYGNYAFDSGEHHFGQDILSKLITKPFIYLSQSSGISVKGYRALKKVVEKKDYEGLKRFPIKYIILRRDIDCTNCPNLSESEIGKKFSMVYKNKLFTVYEIKKHQTIINSENISFSVVNPVKYNVHFYHITKKQSLELLTSFNKDWKIYIQRKSNINCISEIAYSTKKIECLIPTKFFEGEELSYLWKKPLFENSHKLVNGYGNKWTLDIEFIKKNYDKRFYIINKDGSINVDLVIYYAPQSWYYFYIILTSAAFIGMSTYLLKNKFIKSINKLQKLRSKIIYQ